MHPLDAVRRQLEPFDDLVDFIEQARRSPIAGRGGSRAERLIRAALAFPAVKEQPQAVRVERSWQRDGIDGEEISWSVGYGPRTQAYLLRPSNARGSLPGIVALHDHGNYKYYGKEKIADGPPDKTVAANLLTFRTRFYGGRAFANELARAGFMVLVHDVFQWGSRKFPPESMPDISKDMKPAAIRAWRQYGKTEAIARYNLNTSFHQVTLNNICSALGTTVSGIICYEDRVAVNYLASRPDVQRGFIGCIGLSGGGTRAGMLQATCRKIGAAVIVGLMSAGGQALMHDMVFGVRDLGDWPDVVGSRLSPLLVQYCRQDSMFTPTGMRQAHHRLTQLFRDVQKMYTGKLYAERHGFTVEMQEAAFAWLARVMKDSAVASRSR